MRAVFLLPCVTVGALACSYSMSVWSPSSDADPPFYRIWGGRHEGWIDGRGNRIDFEPEAVEGNPDRLRALRAGDLVGYVRSGKPVIPPRFLDGSEFSEGLARVVMEGPCVPPGAGFCGAPIILPPSAIPPSVPRLDMLAGKWRPSAPACRYTFIAEDGEVAGDVTFDDAGAFREGLAAVRTGGLWGYVDRALKVVIAPRFQGGDAFSEGLATVRQEAGVSYIDRTGRVVIQGPFEMADDFHEGVAAVWVNRRARYIDRNGQQAVPGTYPHAGRFFHGVANVQIGDGSLAYIDRKGRVIYRWKPR